MNKKNKKNKMNKKNKNDLPVFFYISIFLYFSIRIPIFNKLKLLVI